MAAIFCFSFLCIALALGDGTWELGLEKRPIPGFGREGLAQP